MKTIVIGSDQNGLELKIALMDKLKKLNISFEDVGCYFGGKELHYPLISKSLCEEIIKSNYQKRGILICGTGIGMSIAANKFLGIHAAVCHDYYSAERSVLSNNINVLCMGAKIIGAGNANIILERWLELEFIERSLSASKLALLYSIEKKNFNMVVTSS